MAPSTAGHSAIVHTIHGDGPSTHGFTFEQTPYKLTRRDRLQRRVRKLIRTLLPVFAPRWYYVLAKRVGSRIGRVLVRAWPLDSDDYGLIIAALLVSMAVMWVAAVAGFSAGLVIRFFNLGVGAG